MSNSRKIWSIISVIFNIIMLVCLLYVCFIATDFSKHLTHEIGHIPPTKSAVHVDCVNSWNNMVCQLEYEADIVFFGDSHMEEGEFQKAFPNYRIVNLGYIGDNTISMLDRIVALQSLRPQKIFIMAGVNGLNSQSFEDFRFHYNTLIDSIMVALPDSKIYIESIPPVAASSKFCSNDKIRQANVILKYVAEELGCEYIDIYSLYVEDDVLPTSLSTDGLHLTPDAYQRWYDKLSEFITEQK